jgi:hypothetical protein
MGLSQFINIAACRPVARQRPRNKQIYGSPYFANMFPRQKFNYNNEKRCFYAALVEVL